MSPNNLTNKLRSGLHLPNWRLFRSGHTKSNKKIGTTQNLWWLSLCVLFFLIVGIFVLSRITPSIHGTVLLQCDGIEFLLPRHDDKPPGIGHELFRTGSLDASYVQIRSFKVFSIGVDSLNSLISYEILPQGEQPIVELSAVEGVLSLTSLKYRGLTTLAISAQDSFVAISLKSAESSYESDKWEAFAKISLPPKFTLRNYNSQIAHKSSSKRMSIGSAKDSILTRHSFAPTVELSELDEDLNLFAKAVDASTPFTIELLQAKEVYLRRFDNRIKDYVSTLVSGKLSYIDNGQEISRSLASGSMLSISMNQTANQNLTIEKGRVIASFSGEIEALKDGTTDILPSLLTRFRNSWLQDIFLILSMLINVVGGISFLRSKK